MPRQGAPHALVVDDDEAIREVVCEVLEQAGWCVTAAAGVREGLTALRSGHHDIVLTDLAMPDGSGSQILQAAARLAAPPPVVVMSGCLGGDGHLQLREAGARHVLPKPFGLMQLLAILHAAVQL